MTKKPVSLQDRRVLSEHSKVETTLPDEEMKKLVLFHVRRVLYDRFYLERTSSTKPVFLRTQRFKDLLHAVQCLSLFQRLAD